MSTRKWGEHPNDGKGLQRISERLKREGLSSQETAASLFDRPLNDGNPDVPALMAELAKVLESLNSAENAVNEQVKGFAYYGKYKAPIAELKSIAMQTKCARLFLEDLIGTLEEQRS